jgi:spoIIIJ-associated protein
MIEKRANIEIIAPTVDEAIQKGLEDLGVPQDAVDIEILDEGSRGLFGLGARQARIRLTIKGFAPSKEPAPVTSDNESSPSIKNNRQSFPPTEIPQEPIINPVPLSEDEDYVLSVSRDTVKELLEKMKVHANVTSEFGVVDDSHSRVPVNVLVNGDDLSILIGRRAETLNALQYIAGLIVSKEIGRSIPLIVDVEGYRSRRETQLRQMAQRMADQAVKTGRRQVLEPMAANERRIIHIELRKNPLVITESIGEDPNRKVTIMTKE